MQKVLKFKLTNKTLPLLPNLKHNMAKEVKMEGDNLIITLAVQANLDYINDLVGFSAKQVEIKTNLLDDADCDVEIYKVSHKKMLKEKSKLGYGKKGNVYAIRDFLRLYKDYPLEENKELYLTSAYYKSHHSFDKFVSFKNDGKSNSIYCLFRINSAK